MSGQLEKEAAVLVDYCYFSSIKCSIFCSLRCELVHGESDLSIHYRGMQLIMILAVAVLPNHSPRTHNVTRFEKSWLSCTIINI